MLKEVKTLTENEIIRLYGLFMVEKAKTYRQNTKIQEKITKNYVLLHNEHNRTFRSFKEIRKFTNELHKNGLISIVSFLSLEKTILYFLHKSKGVFRLDLTQKDCEDYFFSLTKNLKGLTMKYYISRLAYFIEFLKDNGIDMPNISFNKIMILRKRFNKDKKLPYFLNESQYKDFISYVKDMKARTLEEKKRKLIMLLVAYSGIRTREVANIELNDIIRDKKIISIRIQGKGFKERFISIKRELIEPYLDDFLDFKNNQGIKSSYLTQLKNKDEPIYQSIDLKPVLKKINSLQQKSNALHLLRHSFASFVYNKTKDILLTQNVLGHTSVFSTQIYIHLNQEYNKQVAEFF